MDFTAIQQALTIEYLRRLLVKYFVEKGFKDDFNAPMYPAAARDIAEKIPQLQGLVEVVPHAAKVDPAIGKAVIGWNLFVLGNQRAYLGETIHNDMQALGQFLTNGVGDLSNCPSRKQISPAHLISFIIRVLRSSDEVQSTVQDVKSNLYRSIPIAMGINGTGQFYNKSKMNGIVNN